MFDDLKAPMWFAESHLNELVGIKSGFRAAARQHISKQCSSEYMRILDNLGFKFVLLEEKNYVYISNSIDCAKEARFYESEIIKFHNNQRPFSDFCKYVRRLAELFGYPPCCVEFYLSCWLEQGTNILKRTEQEPNYIQYSFRNTANPSKIDFRMNNLFLYRILSFFPCSYGCKVALESAVKVFESLPSEQKKRVQHLITGDFLVIDEFNFMGFQSKYRFMKRCVEYNPEQLRSYKNKGFHLEPIRDGTKIELSDNGVCVFGKNGEKIAEIAQPVYLLRFY